MAAAFAAEGSSPGAEASDEGGSDPEAGISGVVLGCCCDNLNSKRIAWKEMLPACRLCAPLFPHPRHHLRSTFRRWAMPC